ncbi:hypothetical protein [Pseudoroseomonas cervicalis]|uniref:hypothetical protein n=1 Tax=Teichococcus cervicalis TaxID=204525 RepID=UPI0027871E4A|nr:hypothetical protein [Pseudoroseomonas cervicalis]MDQ1079306.1 hypothetical protein [Pseudoroseomonas cervicalis]
MKRLALSLLLLPPLLAACAEMAPRTAEDRQNDAARAACRADAERQMRYRERGQTMRVDEAESRLGSAAFMGNPMERSQLGARFEMDQMIQDCLRSANQGPSLTPQTAPPAGGGRGS